MAKPIQFVMVRAVPLNSGGADAATIVENWGESDITAIPQMHKAMINSCGGNEKSRGEVAQNTPETNRER